MSAADAAADQRSASEGGDARRWPGWPGYTVFRMIVPVTKVGSIIGHKGELIKKMTEESRARVRILHGPVGAGDRVVLITAKEELEAEVSPAMDALFRVFQRTIAETGPDSTAPVASARLLVPGGQAISLIGKQGITIKAIQDGSGATIKVISIGQHERPFYASDDERVVDIQGETTKVFSALQGVAGHLRKFLVDHGVLPLFEKMNNAAPEEHMADPWTGDKKKTSFAGNDHPRGSWESMYHDNNPPGEIKVSRRNLALYGLDPSHSNFRSPGVGQSGPFVAQITQTMQVPLGYAEDIIGVGGANISHARGVSGALITVKETVGTAEELTIEIKGTASQIHIAQDLIQDYMGRRGNPMGMGSSSYEANADQMPPYRLSYLSYERPYPPPSHAAPYSRYGSRYETPGLDGYFGY